MMVGRPVRFAVEKRTTKPGGPLLEVQGPHACSTSATRSRSDGVDFTVHEGEIVGIAGVQGNGQTELVEALTGLRPWSPARSPLPAQDITRASARERHRRGIAHIPEDRQRSG